MIRTRLAPSPTGKDLHLGNLYTALINWAFAKKHQGKFIVRIEDTDRERMVEGAEEKILASLKKFGLKPGEGPKTGGPYAPYRQSERLEIYQKYAEELVKASNAYYCFCSPERLSQVRKEMAKQGKPPKYDRHCLKIRNPKSEIRKGKPYVVRLKIPDNREVVFDDVIRGKIKFKSEVLDDQILLKSDGFPTYHLAVVVDDHLMKISHIIRAEEWISSTPKHILLYEALGFPKPVFAHLPILRNSDRSKLSKRRQPVWASWYLEKGYLPEAVLNYLSLMGWAHPEEKEIFDMSEFISVFDLKDVKALGPAFDPVKLEWMNGEYIRQYKKSKIKNKILAFYNHQLPEKMVEKTVPLIQERIKKLSDYLPLCQFFFQAPKEYEIDPDLIGMKLSDYKDLFKKTSEQLKAIGRWKADKIGKKMQELAEAEGLSTGKFFMILRVAITGKRVTPPLNQSMEILGKKECLARIKKLTPIKSG